MEQMMPGVRPEVPPWVLGNRLDESLDSDVSADSTGEGYSLKRLFDLIIVVAGLIISSPMWLIFSAAIKLEDRGPILFTQNRWGKNKGTIKVYKFRTMVPNAVEKFGNLQAQENDPRITRVGRLLRATSLDEMPQLLNILKGDMSWVGPRALPIDEVQSHGQDANLPDEAIPGFEERAKLLPGLTGIAQIYAPRDIPRDQKYQYDAIYTNRQSLWFDLRIIFLSIWITIRARWESTENKI